MSRESDDASQYKYENVIHRTFTSKIREIPKNPLTDSEKEDFYKKWFDSNFKKEYATLAFNYRAVSDDEIANKNFTSQGSMERLYNLDLYQDAWKLWKHCLDSFDKEKIKGDIAEINIEGEDQPKTLDFYFMAHCRKMTHYHFRTITKQRIKREEEAGRKDLFCNRDIFLDGGDFKGDMLSEEPEENELLNFLSDRSNFLRFKNRGLSSPV